MYIKVNGIELYYEKTGQGCPIILLHGNGESHDRHADSSISREEGYSQGIRICVSAAGIRVIQCSIKLNKQAFHKLRAYGAMQRSFWNDNQIALTQRHQPFFKLNRK